MVSSAMPINIWFHIFAGVIFTALLIVLFPVFKILQQTWCSTQHSTQNHGTTPFSININSPDENPSTWSKLTLTFAVIAFFAFIGVSSFNTIIQYIDVQTLDENYCVISLISLWSLYIAGKFFLITYFIFRAYDSFKNSKYSFNSMVICMTYPIGFVILIGIIVPLAYIVATNKITFALSTVYINDKQYGFQCDATYSNNSQNIEWAIYGIGACIDILFTAASVCLFLYKFAVIIQESAKEHAVISSSRQNSYQTSLLSDENEANSIGMDVSNIDPQEVCDFHAKTKAENRWLLLMTKLLVLLIIEAISTIIAFLIYYLSKVYYFGYVLDAVVCIYCLFLSFEFSDFWYYEIFCGYRFSKFCFPFTKTSVMTLRCLNQDCCGPNAFCWCNNQCFDICFACECGGCCFCCKCYGTLCCQSCYGNHQKKQRQFYLMATSEVDLLLATLGYKENVRKDDELWN